MKLKKIIKCHLKHTADLISPDGAVIPCDVRKITHYSEFMPDLLWISLVSQRPIGRHIELWKKGYKFRFLEG